MGNFNKLAADAAFIGVHGLTIQTICHERAVTSGWWTDLKTDDLYSAQAIRDMVPTKLMLTVSELSEAMEAHRKNLMDDKLTDREGLEVELADALIRIYDLGGALGYDLGAAMAAKLQYNASRSDHTLAARKGAGGKTY